MSLENRIRAERGGRWGVCGRGMRVDVGQMVKSRGSMLKTLDFILRAKGSY